MWWRQGRRRRILAPNPPAHECHLGSPAVVAAAVVTCICQFVIEDHGEGLSVKAGDVFDAPPGHGVSVTGDEPSVTVMWRGRSGFWQVNGKDRALV